MADEHRPKPGLGLLLKLGPAGRWAFAHLPRIGKVVTAAAVSGSLLGGYVVAHAAVETVVDTPQATASVRPSLVPVAPLPTASLVPSPTPSPSPEPTAGPSPAPTPRPTLVPLPSLPLPSLPLPSLLPSLDPPPIAAWPHDCRHVPRCHRGGQHGD